jgi:Uma2 family endonuclease
MPATRTRYRFKVNEYEQMVEFGILNENHPVELIRGEIVDKMPIGSRHAACVARGNKLLGGSVRDQAIVWIQSPVRLADSEPEPDISLLRPRGDFYAADNPKPADVLLLIEVSDATLDFDRDVKGALYAENGILEYWIVNLTDDCLEVHRRPQADGSYADVQVFRRGQQVEIEALPGLVLQVSEFL